MRMAAAAFALSSVFTFADPVGAAPADAQVPVPADGRFIYEIRRQGGDAIGSETVTFRRENGLLRVDVVTESTAHVLFLAFHYSHHRLEDWRDGRLAHLVMDTDDDGDKHHVEAGPDGDHLVLVADGQSRPMPIDAVPLTLWGQDITRHELLFSVVDGETFRVRTGLVGEETLAVGGRALAVRHYRMEGDATRDLWFDADGLLVKTSFERKGYPIEILRR